MPADLAGAIQAFLDYLGAEAGLAANTRAAYRRDLRHLGQFLAGRPGAAGLAALTAEAIDAFLRASHLAGKSPASICRALAAVRMFCRFCVLERLLPADPSQSIAAPKKWNRLPETLAHPSVAALLECPDPDQDAHWRRDRALLTLLYAAGLRAAEAAGLAVGDINFDLAILRVVGKGSKERIVPAAEIALSRLRDYLGPGDPPDRPVFLSRTGRALAREDIFRIVTKYVRRLALRTHVSPHTLRHCFATALLAGGADLRSLQEMLGHASLSTTQVYTHVDASRLKAVHRNFHPRA